MLKEPIKISNCKRIFPIKSNMCYEIFSFLNPSIKIYQFRNSFLTNFSKDFKNIMTLEEKITINLDMSIKQNDDVLTFLEYFKAFRNYDNLLCLGLNLSKNKITDFHIDIVTRIVEKYSNLISLHLNFSFNKIDINGVLRITTLLEKLSKLKVLTINLFHNLISEDALNLFFRFLSDLKLSHLEFYIGFNPFNQISNPIHHFPFKKTDLTYLSLRMNYNNLEENLITVLSEQLSLLINLTTLYLDLGYNKIKSKEMKILSQSFKNLIVLKNLSLCISSNHVDDDSIIYFSDSLKRILSLKSLFLLFFNNEISNLGINVLTSTLSNMNLRDLVLDIGLNLIKLKGILSLSYNLINMITLKKLTLDLFACNISDRGSKYLFLSLSKLTSLTSLNINLNYNYIGNQGCFHLCNMICSLKKLTCLKLYLEYNDLGDESCRFLFKVIQKPNHLEYLLISLSNNNITSLGICIFLRDNMFLNNKIKFDLQLSDNPIDDITKQLISDKYKDKIIF